MKVKNLHSNQKIQDLLKDLNLSDKVELFLILSKEVKLIKNNDRLLDKLKKAPKITEEELNKFMEAKNYVSKLTL